jgi:RNA polymerase sigma factor (TIGR02999 family)
MAEADNVRAPIPAADIGDMIDEAVGLGARCPSELFDLLYRDLHRLAQRQLRGTRVPIGVTTLLHEAYLGLSARVARFPDRSRFFAYAARAMRGVIIDHARAHRALKRGGGFHLTGWDTRAEQCPAEDLSGIGEALDALGAIDPKLAELVDLKFFCGFTASEIAAMRGCSERTVERDWVKARLYLHRSLGR